MSGAEWLIQSLCGVNSESVLLMYTNKYSVIHFDTLSTL